MEAVTLVSSYDFTAAGPEPGGIISAHPAQVEGIEAGGMPALADGSYPARGSPAAIQFLIALHHDGKAEDKGLMATFAGLTGFREAKAPKGFKPAVSLHRLPLPKPPG